MTATTECDGYLWGKTTYNSKNGWCVLDYAERISEQILEGTTIKSIYIAQKPDKVKYNEGDQLDLSGLIVKAVYNDGTEKITVDYDVSGFESAEGTYAIKVSYLNKSTTFTVTVEGKKLTKLTVTSPPDKLVYQIGEGLAIKGLVVSGTYNNGTEEEIKDFYLENVSGFSKEAGIKPITVSVNDIKTTFDVEVTEKVLTDIEVTATPAVTEYVLGQKLDTEGLIVHAVYSNGSKNVIDDYTIDGYNSRESGQQTITVKYSGQTDSFDVNVTEPDAYELPGDLDGSGSRDIFDLVLLNKFLDGVAEFESSREYLADVNLDGIVNQNDVEALSKVISQQ